MVFCRILQYFVAKSVFLRFTLFVAKSVLVRFTRFCVEKNLTKKLGPWRKNYKYEVCPHLSSSYHCNINDIHPPHHDHSKLDIWRYITSRKNAICYIHSPASCLIHFLAHLGWENADDPGNVSKIYSSAHRQVAFSCALAWAKKNGFGLRRSEGSCWVVSGAPQFF